MTPENGAPGKRPTIESQMGTGGVIPASWCSEHDHSPDSEEDES